jgi:2-iminobutanoate/2-iminopropanoate deaminase
MSNLLAVVAAAGHAPTEIVKCTIFLNSLNDLQVVNGIYAEALGGHRPARATVEVARLSRDVLVEIDAICVRGYSRAYCQGFEDEAFDAMFDEVMVTLRRGR